MSHFFYGKNASCDTFFNADVSESFSNMQCFLIYSFQQGLYFQAGDHKIYLKLVWEKKKKIIIKTFF